MDTAALTMIGIGRSALMEQLIIMQQTVISLLSNGAVNNVMTNLIHPNHNSVYTSASNVRQQTLSGLGSQYQRLLQAAPIAPSLTASPDTINNGYNCFAKVQIQSKGLISPREDMKCWTCGWAARTQWKVNYCPTPHSKDGSLVRTECFHQKFHAPKG